MAILKYRQRAARGVFITFFVGGFIVVILFSIGIVLLVKLNSSSPDSSYRDVALLFGAGLAAVGAITATLIAFGSAQKVEEQKDLRERARLVDFERARAEFSIISLHVVATTLDRIYKQARDDAAQLISAAERQDLSLYGKYSVSTREVPSTLRILDELQVNFLKDREQIAVRNIQVYLELLARQNDTVRKLFDNLQRASIVKQSVGDEAFWAVYRDEAEKLEERARALFDCIVPYINARAPGVTPDESKLRLLLGGYASELVPEVFSLQDLTIFLRQAVDDILRQHVAPEDLRLHLRETANQIRDEDAVPIGSKPKERRRVRWLFGSKARTSKPV